MLRCYPDWHHTQTETSQKSLWGIWGDDIFMLAIFHIPGDLTITCFCSFQPLSSEENCHSTHSSQSDSQYGSPPRGWSEELDEHGHTLYVSEYTQEKVQSALSCSFETLEDITQCLLTISSMSACFCFPGNWIVFVFTVDKACGWTGQALLLQRWWIQVRMGIAEGKISFWTLSDHGLFKVISHYITKHSH